MKMPPTTMVRPSAVCPLPVAPLHLQPVLGLQAACFKSSSLATRRAAVALGPNPPVTASWAATTLAETQMQTPKAPGAIRAVEANRPSSIATLASPSPPAPPQKSARSVVPIVALPCTAGPKSLIPYPAPICAAHLGNRACAAPVSGRMLHRSGCNRLPGRGKCQVPGLAALSRHSGLTRASDRCCAPRMANAAWLGTRHTGTPAMSAPIISAATLAVCCAVAPARWLDLLPLLLDSPSIACRARQRIGVVLPLL
jgi:hypothetical protein